jgi:uncharacterized membrane protein YbhN (UPF0104 family)
MLLSGLFWRQVLAASHSPLPLLIAWRAFAISQLAKYVPGKAMVLVVRAGMVSAYGVSAGAVISSSIIETLLWMFVGAQIACLFLLFVDSGSAALRILILFSLCVCGLITVPPNFQKILGLVNRIRKRPQREPNSRPIFDWRTYFWGVVTLSVSWLFAGFSAWLTITSLPDIEFGLDRYGLVLATVAMATVGGFASLLPGGIGVRELVIIPMLSPSIGTLNAVLAAVMIRLTWIVAEAILSVTIELVFRFTRRSL